MCSYWLFCALACTFALPGAASQHATRFKISPVLALSRIFAWPLNCLWELFCGIHLLISAHAVATVGRAPIMSGIWSCYRCSCCRCLHLRYCCSCRTGLELLLLLFCCCSWYYSSNFGVNFTTITLSVYYIIRNSINNSSGNIFIDFHIIKGIYIVIFNSIVSVILSRSLAWSQNLLFLLNEQTNYWNLL